MKKRILSVFSVLILTLSAFPMQALANDSLQTNVVYTYSNASTYEITVPATINLNNREKLVFTANSLNIASNEWVRVDLDPQTFENNKFFLYYNKGQSDEQKISCVISEGGFTVGSDQECALFRSGDTSKTSSLAFDVNTSEAVNGRTYTGTMYFNIILGP